MKKVKVYFADVNNMGDQLNRLIIENVLGYKVEYCPRRYLSETTGIGSFLGSIFPPISKKSTGFKGVIGSVANSLNFPLQIWSSGFLNYPTGEKEIAIRKNVHISSVRGELTRKRLEKILNIELNVPTGDGGLLASELIKEPIEKKYSVGVIAHIKEQEEVVFKELTNNYDNAILIDLKSDPLEVVKLIAQCEVIISTALHGLIVADSFGIPNKRLIYSDKLLGDGYKFDDYYSSFNINPEPFDLNTGKSPELSRVISEYNVPYEVVIQKKLQIKEAFGRNIK